MKQRENLTPLADRQMMGPDGAVYVLRGGTLAAPAPEGRGGASARPQAVVLSVRSRSGEGTPCFAYVADGQRTGRSGEGTPCFAYVADGGQGAGCFAY